jgi:hypothetical protein
VRHDVGVRLSLPENRAVALEMKRGAGEVTFMSQAPPFGLQVDPVDNMARRTT